MSYWLFKLAKQHLYADVPGERYVYDNTHSVRVTAGDTFIYLDKRRGDYEFSGTGTVARVTGRKPKGDERRNDKVSRVFSAELTDVVWFESPVSISPRREEGRKVRAQLGISDVNQLGWSTSIPSIEAEMFEAIIDVVDEHHSLPTQTVEGGEVPDSYSVVKKRMAAKAFSDAVLSRHGFQCVVCGTAQRELLEAAHISPYATDAKNRANPANGLSMCAFCHRAFDRQLIGIRPNGQLVVRGEVDDPILLHHLNAMTDSRRCELLEGTDRRLLEQRLEGAG